MAEAATTTTSPATGTPAAEQHTNTAASTPAAEQQQPVENKGSNIEEVIQLNSFWRSEFSNRSG